MPADGLEGMYIVQNNLRTRNVMELCSTLKHTLFTYGASSLAFLRPILLSMARTISRHLGELEIVHNHDFKG